MYLIGLLPFGIAKIFSLWLYAHKQQGKAAKITAISLAWNIVLSLILIIPLEAVGLALASSLSGFILLHLTFQEFGYKKLLNILAFKNFMLQ
jgi:putative peptidoglycan lipid II flippase